MAAAKSRIGTKYRRVELTEWRTAPPAIDSAFMELGGITRSRIVDELGAIAFANIGQVLTWGDEIQEISEGDTYFINGKEHLAKDCITRVIRQRVRVLPIATMDTSVSRVISEVSQTAKGSVKVKMHDKLAALDKLARALGMYQPIEDAGNNTRSIRCNACRGHPERSITSGRCSTTCRQPCPVHHSSRVRRRSTEF